MSIQEKIGENIEHYRTSNDVSIYELSKRTNLSWQTLSNYEKGKASMKIPTLEQIATALDIKVNQLLKT